MGKIKKVFAIVLACALAMLLVPKAGAEEAREFNPKYDAVFEDFDREDISDTVSHTGNVDFGEKAYLSVTFTDEDSGNPDDAIFKQGQPGADQGAGNIVLVMRAPHGDVELSDIILGTRYSDSYQVYGKSFSELVDADMSELPELTANWQKYIINFANSYEDDEVYLDTSGNPSNVRVNSGSILGLHIYAAEGASGTVDIQTIYTTTDDLDNNPGVRLMWNDFLGADTVDKTKNPNAWWAGSAKGIIRKRTVTIGAGGVLNVLKTEGTGKYEYAVIEADGDLANLKVATTADGETWSEYVPHAAALAINDVKGFSLKYEGDDQVAVRRIFLTNFQEDQVASKYPYIDPFTTQKFDDFNVPTSEINDDYEEMSTRPELVHANLYYRLSYRNGHLVEVKDGNLILDATELEENDYINYKSETKTPAVGYSYVVFKMKAEEGANLEGFRFNFGQGDHVWGNGGLKSDVGLPIAGLGENNPYHADGWSYVVVNIDASGLVLPNGQASTIDLYYSGTGKLYIDEIFFANDLFDEKTEVKLDAMVKEYALEGDYAYLGYVPADNYLGHRYLKLTFKNAENADLGTLRLEFPSGTFWFSENSAGTLLTANGTLVPEMGADEQTVYIDLYASGVNLDFKGFHFHSSGAGTGDFEIVDAALVSKYADALDMENTLVLDDEGSPFIGAYEPEGDGYGYLGYVYAPNTELHTHLLITYKGEEGADLSNLRLEFTSGGMFWFSENAEGTLRTITGDLIPAVSTEAQTVIVDLKASGVGLAFDGFHIHSNGSETGKFEILDAKLLSKADKREFDLEGSLVLDDEGSPFIGAYEPEGDGYGYLGYVYAPNTELHTHLLITYKGEEGADLSNLRLEFTSGGMFWFSENAEGTLRTITGDLIPAVSTEAQTVIVDLEASGVDLAFDGFHIHSNGAETGKFEILDARLLSEKFIYGDLLAELPAYETPDITPPNVKITTPTTAEPGTISVTYDVSDDVSAEDKIEIEIEVKKGSETVTLTDNAFEATPGVYTVTVKARDEAGNEGEDVIQITVEEPQDPEEPKEPEAPKGCKGCKDAAAPGTLAFMGLMGLAFFLIRRKRK